MAPRDPTLPRKIYDSSQRVTINMRAVRPGRYRIVDGVVVEDGGEIIEHADEDETIEHRVLVEEPVPPNTKKPDK